jgi:hypothetical protein
MRRSWPTSPGEEMKMRNFRAAMLLFYQVLFSPRRHGGTENPLSVYIFSGERRCRIIRRKYLGELRRRDEYREGRSDSRHSVVTG